MSLGARVILGGLMSGRSSLEEKELVVLSVVMFFVSFRGKQNDSEI